MRLVSSLVCQKNGTALLHRIQGGFEGINTFMVGQRQQTVLEKRELGIAPEVKGFYFFFAGAAFGASFFAGFFAGTV